MSVFDDAAIVAQATAWKTVDDRKVEVSADEWNAAVRVAKYIQQDGSFTLPPKSYAALRAAILRLGNSEDGLGANIVPSPCVRALREFTDTLYDETGIEFEEYI